MGGGILLLLVAALVLAAYAVYDKLVVFSHVQDELFLAFTSRIMVCLLVVPFLLLPSVTLPSFDYSLISFLTGFLFVLAAWLYFSGVKEGDPSTMIVFLNSKPALVVVAAGLFLGEVLQAIQYLGIVVIIGAALLLTFSRVDGGLQFRSTARYGALFAVTVAAVDLISKYAVAGASPLAFYALAGLGQGIGGAVGLAWLWSRDRQHIHANLGGLRAIGVRTVLYVTGLTLFFISLQTVPISVATSVIATQTAFTVLFIWLLARLGKAPTASLGDIPIHVKLLAATGIVVGVTLLSQPGFIG